MMVCETIRIIPTWKEKYLSTGEKSSFACTTTTKPAKAKKLKLQLCSEALVYIRHCTSVHIKSVNGWTAHGIWRE